ncbi:omega-conotoxin-like protein 1 isoform X1 [Orussus abietinus]|uniref:omega-conotoxin-like protein 1 isoform X1 n=1 Tax=Orussus abietinus TaxID=222816 RepID=UPI000626BDAA|nr:omega-conotoxin-like protein 1 isoform X1 [Orussus abietinus]
MKLVLVLCVVVFATMVVGTPAQKDDATCGRHGDPCNTSEECCSYLWCHFYAHRCVSKPGGPNRPPMVPQAEAIQEEGQKIN